MNGLTIQTLHDIDDALSANDPEGALWASLRLMLDAFDCERAFLATPCEPDTPTYEIPFEVTRPTFAGTSSLGKSLPVGPTERALVTALMASPEALVVGGSTNEPTGRLADLAAAGVPLDEASVRICVRPHLGPAWMFGIVHGPGTRAYTDDDVRLFTLVSGRFEAALSVWVVDQRLSRVSGLEALGLMVSSLAADLSAIIARISAAVKQLEGDDAVVQSLRTDTMLAQRLVARITTLGTGTSP